MHCLNLRKLKERVSLILNFTSDCLPSLLSCFFFSCYYQYIKYVYKFIYAVVELEKKRRSSGGKNDARRASSVSRWGIFTEVLREILCTFNKTVAGFLNVLIGTLVKTITQDTVILRPLHGGAEGDDAILDGLPRRNWP